MKFYLGEEPILKNVPTWRCREPEHLRYVLDHLEELVVKEVHGSGGYGMLIGPKADKSAIAAFRAKLKPDPQGLHRPADAGALDLPDLRRGRRRAAPRRSAPVRAHRPRPHPHRAGRAHARGAEAGLAGGQFEPGRRHQGHLGAWGLNDSLPLPTKIRPTHFCWIAGCGNDAAEIDARYMLSRTADNLYWLARYVERAEYLARILEATQRLTATAARLCGTTNEWESRASRPPAAPHAFFAALSRSQRGDRHRLSRPSPTANPSSIRNCFEVARTNARAVRTALTMEMWEAINGAWLELKRFGNGPTSREEFARFLRWVQEILAALRRLGLPHHAAQRRLLVLAARRLHRARRQHRAHPRREISPAAAGARARRRPARLFPVGGDPALGLGAHRLSLGLSREPQALADRRPADPQRPDAALARRAATRTSCATSTTSRGPMAGRARRSGRPARSARGCRTAAWRRFSRAACTSSSATSSPTTTGSAAPSPSNI